MRWPSLQFIHFIPLEVVRKFIFDVLGAKTTEKFLRNAILGLVFSVLGRLKMPFFRLF